MAIDDDDHDYWAAWMNMSSADYAATRDQAERNARDAYDADTQAMATGWDSGTDGAAQDGAGVDKFATGVRRQMEQLFRQRAATISAAARLPLRGMIDAPAPTDPQGPTQSRYYADLAHPADIGAMTTCANGDCRRSYIDPHPAAGLAVRTDPAALRAQMARFLAGGPVDLGPTITFVNNEPRNPSPNQPLTTATARMVAAGFLQSGAKSMNIDSSAGGRHVLDGRHESLHYKGQAVDVNRVNGQHVSPAYPARFLQDALLAQPNIAEDYGPSYLINDKGYGRVRLAKPKLVADHRSHLHFGGDH